MIGGNNKGRDSKKDRDRQTRKGRDQQKRIVVPMGKSGFREKKKERGKKKRSGRREQKIGAKGRRRNGERKIFPGLFFVQKIQEGKSQTTTKKRTSKKKGLNLETKPTSGNEY